MSVSESKDLEPAQPPVKVDCYTTGIQADADAVEKFAAQFVTLRHKRTGEEVFVVVTATPPNGWYGDGRIFLHCDWARA